MVVVNASDKEGRTGGVLSQLSGLSDLLKLSGLSTVDVCSRKMSCSCQRAIIRCQNSCAVSVWSQSNRLAQLRKDNNRLN